MEGEAGKRGGGKDFKVEETSLPLSSAAGMPLPHFQTQSSSGRDVLGVFAVIEFHSARTVLSNVRNDQAEPATVLVGGTRFELVTSSMSRKRSNQLS